MTRLLPSIFRTVDETRSVLKDPEISEAQKQAVHAQLRLEYLQRPLFNRGATCKKCGAGHADVEYCPGTFHLDPVIGPWFGNELLKRTCLDCGYSWYERPLDSEAM